MHHVAQKSITATLPRQRARHVAPSSPCGPIARSASAGAGVAAASSAAVARGCARSTRPGTRARRARPRRAPSPARGAPRGSTASDRTARLEHSRARRASRSTRRRRGRAIHITGIGSATIERVDDHARDEIDEHERQHRDAREIERAAELAPRPRRAPRSRTARDHEDAEIDRQRVGQQLDDQPQPRTARRAPRLPSRPGRARAAGSRGSARRSRRADRCPSAPRARDRRRARAPRAAARSRARAAPRQRSLLVAALALRACSFAPAPRRRTARPCSARGCCRSFSCRNGISFAHVGDRRLRDSGTAPS